MRRLLGFCVFTVLQISGNLAKSSPLVSVTEDTWRDILKNEWMIEFYAPWCPACKDLSKAWAAFADWSQDLDINVAAVDVTANPGLSGRFLVTALPTIYHVKDGVFRHYTGPRDKEDFISFIEDKKWSIIEPVPSWKYPDTIQMSVVARLFKMSMAVRDAHTYLVEKKGIPATASYLVFGGATLVLGCLLGYVIVYMIDMVFPADLSAKTPKGGKGKDSGKNKKQSANSKPKENEKKDVVSDKAEAESDQDGDNDMRQRKKEGSNVANGKTANGISSKN